VTETAGSRQAHEPVSPSPFGREAGGEGKTPLASSTPTPLPEGEGLRGRTKSAPDGKNGGHAIVLSLDPRRLRFLLAVLLLAVLPHLWHLHWSHTALFLGFWAWRRLGIARPRLLPRGVWLPLLTLSAAGVVIVTRHGAIDLTTSTGLFVAGLGLKLMELKSGRDVYFTVLLGWFVILTQFLYDQSLGMAAWALAGVSLLTAALVRFDAAGWLGWRRLARHVAILVAPAVPVMVLLFLFFPRPQGGFIHLPFGASARTGLSEVMEPGAVSRLAASAEVAFRVDFDGAPPPPAQRYWRAQVFWRFDGRRWLAHPAMRRPAPRPPPGGGREWRYQVTVEPHHRRWLFSLGTPASIPPEAVLTRDGVLLSPDPLDERIRYALRSRERYRFSPLTSLERRAALQLPAPPSGRIQALVATLGGGDDPEAFAASVLAWFRDRGFRYTLNPGALGGHPVESFLFETRAGFCEHYASAFVYLMRAAGIPARIVGGYMGGFVNPRGGFLEVYQANAHAWAEIWVEGKGWVRVDPTRAVAPAYVEQVQSLDEPLTESAAERLTRSHPEAVRKEEKKAGIQNDWPRRVRILLSAIDHRWHLWVLGYDRRAQARLLGWLGERWPGLVLSLAGLLAWRLRRRASPSPDPLTAAYDRFLRRLGRKGLVKAGAETPAAFARRAARTFPQWAEQIDTVTRLFLQAHYGRGDRRRAARALQAALRRWRP